MFRFTDNIPIIMFTLISLPWTVAGSVAALIGGVKLGRKKSSTRPLKVAISNLVDLSMWMNGTTIGMGIMFFNLLKSTSFLNPYFAMPLVSFISLLVPIVGVPVILDFLMPKLWKILSCQGYGLFEGKLVRDLIHSWRNEELQREFFRVLKMGLLVVLMVYAVLIILVLLGFLRLQCDSLHNFNMDLDDIKLKWK